MMRFTGLYTLLAKRAAIPVVVCLVLVAAAAFAVTRFAVREDVTTLMPAQPAALAEQFEILREAPLLQGVTITVGGPDPARSAAVLANALRGPDIPHVFSNAATGFSPAMPVRLCALSPGLMSRERLDALPDLLTEEAMRASLARDARVLLTPKGLALREMLALDPFGLCGAVLGDMWGGFSPGTPDGAYAMVLAEPAASMGDSQAAAAVMAKIREAVALLPDGTEVFIAGGYRHTEANAGVIREDMARVLPLSLAFLIVFFLVFVRSWRGMGIFLLPAASLAVSAACAGFFYGSLSGIVLGFGSVVLGITADYAIHVYYAVRTGKSVADSLERVSRPLLLGAATTLAGFAAFFASSIPCIVQMAVFAMCGVAAALLMALLVLPHCLGQGRVTPAVVAECGGGNLGSSRPLAALWLALGVMLSALLSTMPINGDVRMLSYTPEAIARDEARTREIWGGLRERAMVAVRGETLEAALENNDRLRRELSLLPAASGFDAAATLSLASFLPSTATQAERHAAWRAFWHERRSDMLSSLTRLAPEFGFSGEAFAPFTAWISSEPEIIRPETLTRLGLPLPFLFLREIPGKAVYVYTLLPAGVPSQPFLEAITRSGAVYVSGQTFRDALADATRDDMRRFGLLALALIVGMAACILRSPYRVGVALLPVAAGLVCVLGVFRVAGLNLTIFHAMALPLIMALGVDYGVFMLARQEGVLDKASAKGVLLSGLTTLSGFASLLLAQHPALFSLGLTVTLGLAAALVTALFLVPRFAGGRGTVS